MYWIAGCDEVGRGALAGPIVAAAVLVRKDQSRPRWLPARRDSKLLTSCQRDDIARRAADNFLYSLALIEAREIDSFGIQQANKRVILQAVTNLPVQPNQLIIDYVAGLIAPLPLQLIKHGDRDYWPIALASVMAKVYRDWLMSQLHRYWPNYGFNKHMGYGTAMHRQNINRFGLCPVHRQSFISDQLILPAFVK